MPVCSQLLILLFAATDFLHRTVQILVTIYIWNYGCLMSLNNIEQTATKTEQQWNYRARQVSFGDVSNVSNVWRVYLQSRHSLSSHSDPPSPLLPSHGFVIPNSMPRFYREDLQEEGDHEQSVHL